MVGPVASRKMVEYVQDRYQVSQRRACRMLSLDRSSMRYRPQPKAQNELRQQVCELAEQRPRFGYRRLTTLLRRSGQLANHKRVYRIYRQEGLAVRRRKRKHIAPGQCPLLNVLSQPGEEWSLDFTQDTLATGRSFRTLNIIDSYSRLCLAIEVDTSLPCARVIRILERLQAEHGLPQRLRIDHGPEFTAQALDAWAYQHAVQLLFIQPANRCRMASSRVSMASFAMSVSISTGFWRSMMPVRSLMLGGSTTILFGHIVHSTIYRRWPFYSRFNRRPILSFRLAEE